MTKYELIAKCAKYTAIVASVFLAGHFGFTIYFDPKDNDKGL
jgi:hypothetical protein